MAGGAEAIVSLVGGSSTEVFTESQGAGAERITGFRARPTRFAAKLTVLGETSSN